MGPVLFYPKRCCLSSIQSLCQILLVVMDGGGPAVVSLRPLHVWRSSGATLSVRPPWLVVVIPDGCALVCAFTQFPGRLCVLPWYFLPLMTFPFLLLFFFLCFFWPRVPKSKENGLLSPYIPSLGFHSYRRAARPSPRLSPVREPGPRPCLPTRKRVGAHLRLVGSLLFTRPPCRRHAHQRQQRVLDPSP